MKLGISHAYAHSSPEEWALLHKNRGLEAVVFPLDYRAADAQIEAYAKAAHDAGLVIAEVGAWSNPLSPDPKTRQEARTRCIRSLELADAVGAVCCVNIAGAVGEVWDGSYPENYDARTYAEIVACTQEIIDTAKPKRACYALEPMPHMLPDSPENYLQLLRDIDRAQFGVHLDVVNIVTSPRIFYHSAELIDRCFDLLGPYVKSCHLKDCVLSHELTVSIRETECGKGGLDLRRYIERAEACDPNLPMILEHLPTAESYDASIDYIRSLYAQVR